MRGLLHVFYQRRTFLAFTVAFQVLHVCHRSAAFASSLITCRLATPIDRLSILELVTPLPDGPTFMDAVVAAERCATLQKQQQPTSDPAAAPLVTVVAEVGGVMVGAFVLSTAGSTPLAWQAVTHSFDLDTFVMPHLYLPTEVRTGIRV